MAPLVLQRPNALSPTLSSLPFRAKRSLFGRSTARPSPLLRPPLSTSFLRLPRSLNFKGIGAVKFDVPAADAGDLSEIDDGDLVVETCIVRTLPPALTLEHGLEKIKEALEKLKLDPPRSSRGMLRFQVCVPPSAKALSWFCSQPDSSVVFPQFFLSKETDNPTCKSLLLHDKRGIFGIGAAVQFSSSSSSNNGDDRRIIRRYLSNESTLITIYGFLDIDFDTESSSMKNEAGSFSFFIPQIELDENVGVSTLAATLSWDGTCLHSVEEAIDSCELSLYQASSHFWPGTEKCHTSNIRSTIKKLDMLETKSVPMVYLNTLSGRDFVADPLELKKAPSSCQFCFKLSPTFAVSSNMLDRATEMSFSLQSHANINAVWASLIIEECSRLGLTYFCVAPGSRSSPLAIAASSHPLITCIACYDERSLAFHALGYARGSRKPAAVITSSGTAVSNLLPAVVEASQDFIPLLLLTADRPPELHDAGANQAINQVNHFGSFVRFFFSLPVPSDHIPARMVLTTLDSAVHWATSSPYGPVHINCPFREPLDNSPSKWLPSCLNGLDSWMLSPEPLTKYIRPQHFRVCQDTHGQMTEVMKLINEVDRGLLIIGAIHTEDEIWAALLLAKHLSWPIVADILSGLRLRKILTRDIEDGLVFVDHLDHALLSDSVRDWVRMDAVIQIGSKITSKQVSQILEDVFPRTYIMVADHSCRHDPSHIVTHRIQSSIVQFANCLLGSQLQRKSGVWSGYLQALNMTVSRDLAFQILATQPLTEPQLAYTVSEALLPECALFVGNSMAIRDADMYGHSHGKCNDGVAAMMSNSKLPCHGVQVVGNRGASGIDGLLSTAVGFAVGCNKRVFCVIGDVSFLHDTNGLSILNQRASRKPMTILVINNHGGAIFSLLPIANRTEPKVMDQYFYTSHDISVNKLCSAHGVKHVRVRTKLELQDALLISQHEEEDSVIEVESCISSNASFHSILRNSARQAADHALGILSGLSAKDSLSPGFSLCKIREMEFSLYRIALLAPPTSTLVNDQTRCYRQGFILSLSLEDGSVGFGEVAPLEIHRENLLDVEEQLKFLLHIIKGAKIGYSVPLLMGSFSSWIWSELGIPPSSIFPSVRCGLEMAILGAIAARQGSSLLNLLHPLKDEATSERSSGVRICALLDSDGTPEEVAYLGATLVDEGFTAIKLKVARRGDPTEDAVVVQEVRERVGHQIELRVDANRNWSYEEAIEFGLHVKNCNLQYIEEPVRDEDDIVKFCEETDLPVALDETIENIQGNPLVILEKYIHPRIVAVVIKPSVVGGFENAAIVARWAQQHEKMAVLSATFESSVGLSAYAQFSYYLELQNVERCKVMNKELGSSLAHGLGTYRWLEEDVTTDPLRICRNPCNGFVEASVTDANRLLQEFRINREVVQKTYSPEQVREYRLNVDSNGFSYSIKVHETGQMINSNVVVFLHGFLGTGEDWIDIMKAVSGSARCISIDLPGHGKSTTQDQAAKVSAEEPTFSIENIADVLCRVIDHITNKKVTIVGYSMGARIALFTALRFSDKVKGAVIISGSPGLRDNVARKIRKARDDSKARALVSYGLKCFLDSWYAGDLWKSLREHPRFERIVTSRAQQGDAKSLAKALSDLSTGRQPSLWEDLKRCEVPLLVIVGEKDVKFKKIAREMIGMATNRRDDSIHDMVEVPSCGHAVHLENPPQTIQVLGQFLTRLSSKTN